MWFSFSRGNCANGDANANDCAVIEFRLCGSFNLAGVLTSLNSRQVEICPQGDEVDKADGEIYYSAGAKRAATANTTHPQHLHQGQIW
ncbi:hypothetical protein [Nostoc sp. MS1]|uniref:hypothetical protein n=1 Tax=Nostoc sp. MS1 TaxID=2764711 RepID=UPI001CC6A16C|nr:hypothetical protein [Nostoc sp. MS1]